LANSPEKSSADLVQRRLPGEGSFQIGRSGAGCAHVDWLGMVLPMPEGEMKISGIQYISAY